MRFALILSLLLLSLGVEAATGARSVSHSEWRIDQRQVTLRIEFPVAEAAALVGKRYPLLTTENVGKYVLERVGVSAGGKGCPATDQGYDLGQVNALSLGSDLYGFEIVFRCASAGALTLRNTAFMEDRPGHVDYAVVEATGGRVSQLFTANDASHDIVPTDPMGVSPVRFVRLGFGHVAGSLSRLGGLLALLLLGGRHRLRLLAALAGGYALAWLLALSDLQPEIPHLEATIGFISVCAAIILIAPASPRRPYRVALLALAALAICLAVTRHPRDGMLLTGLSVLAGALLFAESLGPAMPLLVLGTLFGTIDGFVLPGDFARLRLDRVDLLPLAAFGLGSLVCAALLLCLAWAVVRLLGRSRLSGSRFAIHDLATSLLSGFGLFWLLSPL